MAEGKVSQLHTPRRVPPPELTPAEKNLLRSKGVVGLDHIAHLLTDRARDFEFAGDEGTQDAITELCAEVEAILDGLAVGR